MGILGWILSNTLPRTILLRLVPLVPLVLATYICPSPCISQAAVPFMAVVSIASLIVLM